MDEEETWEAQEAQNSHQTQKLVGPRLFDSRRAQAVAVILVEALKAYREVGTEASLGAVHWEGKVAWLPEGAFPFLEEGASLENRAAGGYYSMNMNVRG